MKVTERGWIGHFILADRCIFRRNTLIEHGGVRVVVSSVGDMTIDGKRECVGSDRFYETKAFHAAFEAPYWDTDVCREVEIKTPLVTIEKITRESDMIANDNHEKAVLEIKERIMSGDLGRKQ